MCVCRILIKITYLLIYLFIFTDHFYANQYLIQATGKDDDANANHLCDTAGADDKENDLRSKPF